MTCVQLIGACHNKRHSLDPMGIRPVCLQPRGTGLYSPGSCGDTNNYLAAEENLQGYLDTPQFVP